MHKITTDGNVYSLRVELISYEGEFIYAEYETFWIGPESDDYRLHVTGYFPNSTACKIGLSSFLKFILVQCYI